MPSYMNRKRIKIISPNYTFLAVNSKLRHIWKFSNESFQTEPVDGYCVMPEPRVRLLLVAARPYSAILDACAAITALMKRLENNFQLTVGCWKFNLKFSHAILSRKSGILFSKNSWPSNFFLAKRSNVKTSFENFLSKQSY